MKRLPKVKCKTDIPGLFFHKWGQYSDTFSVPEITFNADDENPAYDHLCANGFVNFSKMYRENLTGFPYFHSDFWNEDVLAGDAWPEGMSYGALSGYEASNSDEENLPYVAAHCQDRSQCYINNINTGGLKQNSRITNFDDFEVSFDYKCDSVGRFDYGYTDPFYPAGYSFLYSQPVHTTSYNTYQIYIVNVSGGNRRMVFAPLTPVKTCSSNSSLRRISLTGSSNSMPIISPCPRTSLIPSNFLSSARR